MPVVLGQIDFGPDHRSIREADEAAEVIVENLDWLFPVGT